MLVFVLLLVVLTAAVEMADFAVVLDPTTSGLGKFAALGVTVLVHCQLSPIRLQLSPSGASSYAGVSLMVVPSGDNSLAWPSVLLSCKFVSVILNTV